MLKCHSARGDT
jgi:hypothetical protein